MIGFTVTVDVPYDHQGDRRVEGTSADGAVARVLSAAPEDRQCFAARDDVPTANFFYADDIEKTSEQLSAKGVEFPVKPERQPWGWWSMFVDSEGNRFALLER